MATQGNITNAKTERKVRATGKGKSPGNGPKPPIIPVKSRNNGQSDARLAAELGSGPATADKGPSRGRTRGRGSASARSPEDLTIVPTAKAGIDLASRAERVNQHHEKRLKAFGTCLGHARDAGDELLAVKEAVGHGNFQEWLKENCAFSYETAANYMRIATHWDELTERFASKSGIIADLGIVKALAHIAKPKGKTVAAQDGAKHGDVGNAPKGPEERKAGVGSPGSAGADPEAAEPDDNDAIPADPSGPSGGSPSGRGGEQADRLEKSGSTPPAPPPAGPNPEQQRAGAGPQENRGGEKAEAEEPGSIPSDERSLAAFPLRAALAAHDNTATFDMQASIYRRVRPAIDQLSRLYQPTEHDIRAIDHTDAFGNLCSCWIALLLRVKPPEEWALCKRCQGAGKSGSTGETCGSCEGAGYRMPSVFTEPVDG